MPRVILEPVPAGGALPAPLLAELTALYASQQAFHTLSGEFPDPADIRPEQVADAVAAELALWARSCSSPGWTAGWSPW